jgi:hypothetical protein
VSVAVAVGVDVLVGVAVNVLVAVGEGVIVGVLVGVIVGVDEAMEVGVNVTAGSFVVGSRKSLGSAKYSPEIQPPTYTPKRFVTPL